MAVVDDIRALGVLDARVGEVVRRVEDAHLSPSLVAKAAATFGLPNLLHRTRAPSNPQCSERYQERSGTGITKTESCCSCTPLACRLDRRGTEDDNFIRSPSSNSTVLHCPAPRDNRNEELLEIKEQMDGKTTCSFSFHERADSLPNSTAGSQISTLCDITTVDGNLAAAVSQEQKEGEGEGEGEKRVGDAAVQEHSLNDYTEEELALDLSEKKRKMREYGQISAEESKVVRGEAVSVKQQNVKTAHWRRVADYEKEWTFRPKLNHVSLRLAAQAARSSLPVSHRLYEKRTQSITGLQENFTFCPKLNAASLRLAQERAQRLPEVQARMSQLAAQRLAEACSQYTFHPNLSQRSLRIAQRMETDFLARQKQHLVRRQCKASQLEDNRSSRSLLPQQQYCRKSRPISLPTSPSPSTPPHGTTLTPARTHTHTSPCPLSEGRGQRRRLLYCRSTQSPKPSTNARRSPCKTPQRDSTRRSPCKTPQRDSTTNARRSPCKTPQRDSTRRSPCKTPQRDSTTNARRSPCKTPQRESTTTPSDHKRASCTPVSSPSKRSSCCSNKIPPVPDGPWSQLNESERVRRVKALRERAIKDQKVFVCRGGYRTICKCLRDRGWVERDYNLSNSSKELISAKTMTAVGGRRNGCGRSHDPDHTSSDSSSDSREEEGEGEGGDMEEEEYQMLCRAVRNVDPNFVWTLRRDDSLYRNMLSSTFANHFAKASSFTTKVGLCKNLRGLVWCGESTSDLFFPRCYLLSNSEEKDIFIDDYRFTTALNLLKLTIDQHWGEFRSPNNTFSAPSQSPINIQLTTPSIISRPPNTLNCQNTPTSISRPSSNGGPPGAPCPPPEAADEKPVKPEVSEEAIELALRACAAYVSSRQHEDIEEEKKCLQLTNTEWQDLLRDYYKIVLERGHIACSSETVRRAANMLDELESCLPQLHMDGTHNIWIVKPGAMSRGRGIMCVDRLEPILELVSSPVHKEGRWVVQKYIERPLLIHGTKFDIRQWFLVTSWNPLTMWMYKDSYLRFATQKFTLDNMNESIHLCNNSIQKHYVNSGSRSDLLPDENMWHCSTFKDYLQSLGQPQTWDQVIYPGMRHALTCAMKVSQDLVEGRENSFELYGADFMLTDDFKPWLIEINCSPTMEASTSVTSQLCTKVMEDTIRVVLDRREDKVCDTGRFELAYKQPKFETPAYVGIQLCVEGVAICRSHTHQRSTSLPVATLSYTNT